MSKKNIGYEGGISQKYVKKEMLKTNLILIPALTLVILFIWLMISVSRESVDFIIPLIVWYFLIIFAGILPYLLIVIISYFYYNAYIRNFYYQILADNIIITHGVFTKIKATIPFSRIQNINIVNGVFDRMFKLFTVKVETAGAAAAVASAQHGYLRPEGYIPALLDPKIIEEKINEMVTKFSGIPSGLEDKIFKPEELAFDNFISYILSKMREGESLRTSIKELRERQNVSASLLAEKVGVPVQTIKYLEEGRYNPSLALAYKIADVLNCKVEDLFKLA